MIESSKKLFDAGIRISRCTVIRIIKKNQQEQKGIATSPQKFDRQNGRTVRTAAIIKKVSLACSKRNPPTQRHSALRYGVSQTSIQIILERGFGLERSEEANYA